MESVFFTPVNFFKLLKKLIPDLAPLLGYVIADLIWGKGVSFYVGTGLGLLGFVYKLAKERKPDWLLLGDTILLAVLGGISLYAYSELFVHLKPAIIEGILAVGLLVVTLVPAKTLGRWTTRLLDGYPLDDKTMTSLRSSLMMLTAVFWLHIALTIWAAFAASTPVWRFVSGGLLYIIFGIALLLEWLAARRKSRETPWRKSRQPAEPAEAGTPVRWALLVMSENGGILAAKVDRSATDIALWDTPLRGAATSSAQLAQQINSFMARLGLDASSVRARTGRGISVQPLFLMEDGQETPLARDGALGVDGLFGTQAPPGGDREVVFAVMLGVDAFPKGGDPTERRLWSMKELEALSGSGKISPRFMSELRLLASSARAPASDPCSPDSVGAFTAGCAADIVTEEKHAIL